MIYRRFYLAFLFLLGGCFLSSVVYATDQNQTLQGKSRLPTVEAISEELDCLVEPYEVVELSSQVPGILKELLVERGDLVESGEIVARLQSDLERAAVDLAMARLEFGRRKVERNEELSKKQLISAHEKDEMETEVRLAELELRVTQERLKLRTITSPIQGVIKERTGAPGEYVGEDPFLTIVRLNPLNVEVVVPLARLGKIKKGMRAEVLPETQKEKKYYGRVVIVDQLVDAASGTFGVRVELPNSSYKLPAGLKCKVRFLAN